MMSIPNLPSLHKIPFYLAIDGVTGYLYGVISQVNPLLTMTIFTIRGLAQSLFYLITNAILKTAGLQSQKVFIMTSFTVNMTFLIAMRELNLIGRFFSCVLGLAIIGHLIHRVRYIQEKERFIEDEQKDLF